MPPIPAHTRLERNGWLDVLLENSWIAHAEITASLLFLTPRLYGRKRSEHRYGHSPDCPVSLMALADDTQGQGLSVTNAAWEESDDNE